MCSLLPGGRHKAKTQQEFWEGVVGPEVGSERTEIISVFKQDDSLEEHFVKKKGLCTGRESATTRMTVQALANSANASLVSAAGSTEHMPGTLLRHRCFFTTMLREKGFTASLLGHRRKLRLQEGSHREKVTR